MPRLQIMTNDAEVRTLTLSGPVVIGRTDGCDVTVADSEMSRRHCRLEPGGDDDNVWRVVDLGSKNGIWMSGRRVESSAALSDGATVQLGRTTLTFHLGADHFDSLRGRVRSIEAGVLSDDDVLAMLQADVPSPDDALLGESSAEAQDGISSLSGPAEEADEPLPRAATKASVAAVGADKTAAKLSAAPVHYAGWASIAAATETKKPGAGSSKLSSFAARLRNRPKREPQISKPAPATLTQDGEKWYRRKLPAPLYIGVVVILGVACLWEAYVMLFAGPSVPRRPHPNTAAHLQPSND